MVKRFVALALAGTLLTTSLPTGAQAGGQDAAIALGIGLLTGAVVGIAAAIPKPVVVSPISPSTVLYAPPPPQWVPGHWENQWAPTTTQLQVWVPGYHDAYGHWTPGYYQTQVIQSGAWTRVLVPGHWE